MTVAGAPLLLPDSSLELFSPEVLGGTAVVLALLVLVVLRLRSRRHALRLLLGGLAGPAGAPVGVFLRGLFTPAGEYFSRAPEDLRHPTAGLTVHKWSGVPEVHSAAEIRALADVLSLLLAYRADLSLTVGAGDPARQSWAEGAVVIGPHHKAQQILDSCEPRVVAYRNPNAFRSLNSPEIFEAREGTDLGLIYKGHHSASHRDFWVLRGLGDSGTEAAARFLLLAAPRLARLTGKRGFACVVVVDRMRGPAHARMQWLAPRPSWWRRLLYRRTLEELARGPGAPAPPG